MRNRTWAVVLAGGEGSRLSDLTTTRSGVRVPKQFCSLTGGPSLLRETLERAAAIVPRSRIAVVVSESHRAFWRDELADLPAENVLVQPASRGTAPGILLPALHVARRDPGAKMVVLPSDHHVENEAALRASFGVALDAIERERDRIALLGVTPDSPDTQYGWIVPSGRVDRGLRPIELFVEKPPLETARALEKRGGLWSSFLFACHVATLLEGFERALPALHCAFLAASGARSAGEREALYRSIAPADFSRDVLERITSRLGVIAVPACGWSDLGTPARVANVLALRRARAATHGPSRALDLSLALSRVGAVG